MSAADQKTPGEPEQTPDADPLLQAGIELLRTMPGAEERECHSCGRPSGIFEECQRCFLDRIESQMDELIGPPAEAETEPEAEPAPEQEPEPEEEEPQPAPPAAPAEQPAEMPTVAVPAATHRFDRGRILAVLGAGAVLVVAALLIFNGSDDSVTAGDDPQPVALTGTADGNSAAVLGTWSGRVEIRYASGFRDQMNQTVSVKRLMEGGPAGFSRSTQNGGTCRGPLTYLSTRGEAFRFRYRELNTDECIAKGTVTLTPLGDSRLEYREVTESSVNRGTLARR